MLERHAAVLERVPGAADVVGTVHEIAARELAPLVQKIDAEGHYPLNVMRALGRAGAFATHLPNASGGADLAMAIRAMTAALGALRVPATAGARN